MSPSKFNVQTTLKTTALEPVSLSISMFMKQSVILVFTLPGANLTGTGQILKNFVVVFPNLKILHRVALEEYYREDIR